MKSSPKRQMENSHLARSRRRKEAHILCFMRGGTRRGQSLFTAAANQTQRDCDLQRRFARPNRYSPLTVQPVMLRSAWDRGQSQEGVASDSLSPAAGGWVGVRGRVETKSVELVHVRAAFPPQPGPLPRRGGEGNGGYPADFQVGRTREKLRVPPVGKTTLPPPRRSALRSAAEASRLRLPKAGQRLARHSDSTDPGGRNTPARLKLGGLQ